ncbi:MAG TPA: sigma-70 family RNA polymerase sigma factor [Edaphobacter sp.]|nr:sigma-70 family RNA polymerase sigma factor [Edaphobacter sp.]
MSGANVSVADKSGCEVVVSKSLTTEERVAALFETYRMKIYSFLVSQGLGPAEAQEATQEVFFRFFVAVEKGAEIEAEPRWLFRVASKLAVDYWRREGRPMWVELDALPDIVDSLRSQEPTPEAAALRAQRLTRVAAAIARLPNNQRLAIHLRMQGLRYREIAQILSLNITAVSDLLSTAVERLRSAANE